MSRLFYALTHQHGRFSLGATCVRGWLLAAVAFNLLLVWRAWQG